MAVKKPGTAIKNYDAELAALAQEGKKQEENTSLGQFISTKGGILTYKGNEVEGGTMNVVIIDSILENHYYTEEYDADNPASPVCFAFARSDKDMAPHEKSTEKQHAQCKGCPQNEFGTAIRGKGKACKNIRRLSLITEDALENVEEAEVAFLKIPVTSVKAWAGYVDQLDAALHLPPLGVVTEIQVKPDTKTLVKVSFKLVGKIEDGNVIEALLAKRKVGSEAIMMPYQPFERDEAPAPQPKARQKFRR
jgi:hypothetical protein